MASIINRFGTFDVDACDAVEEMLQRSLYKGVVPTKSEVGGILVIHIAGVSYLFNGAEINEARNNQLQSALRQTSTPSSTSTP